MDTCEYCGGHLGPAKPVGYLKELFEALGHEGSTHYKECTKCFRRYTATCEAGPYVLVKPPKLGALFG